MKTLALRKINHSDIPLLTEWLNKDYISKWYHDTDDWLREINGRNDKFNWIHHFIVMDEQTPVGFCQYYDCYDADGMENWYEVVRRGDTFSIDYLIGNESYLGKGYGKSIVKLLTETVFKEEKAKQIIVQPDEDNYASNHVLMANGFVYDECKKYYYKRFN
jgi:Acetyltransferases, including N-acetylases of ribosomal proteins